MYARFAISLCAAAFVPLFVATPVRAAAADDAFREAAGAYAAKNWTAADQRLSHFLKEHPEHPQAATAQFFLAETRVQLGRHQEARTGYLAFLQSHPQHRLAGAALFRAGEAAYLSGQRDAAVPELERFRVQYPDDSRNAYVLGYLAELALHGGRPQEAQQLYAETLKRFPDGPTQEDCRFGLGRAAEAQGDFANALRTYEALVRSGGRLADDAQVQMGSLHYNRGQFDLAERAFRAALAVYPDSEFQATARYWMGMSQTALGRSLLEREQYEQAIAVFQRWTEDQAALPVPPPAAATDNGTPAARRDGANWYYLAMAYLGAGRHREALEALGHVHPAADQRKLADGVRVAEALAHLGLEQYAEAIPRLRAYLTAQPNGAEAPRCRLELAAALTRTGQLGEALALHGETPASATSLPSFPSATHTLAEAARAAGQWDDARRLFGLLTEGKFSDRYDRVGLFGLASTQFQSGNFAAAADTWGRLLERHPRCEQAADAGLRRAQALEKLDRPADAIAAYLAVRSQHADHEQAGTATLEAARLEAARGRKQAAADLLQEFLQERPQDERAADALYERAWLLIDLQRPEAAETLFAELSERHRRTRYWADATYRLAERAAQAGQHGRARHLAQTLLDADCDPAIQAYAFYLQGQLAGTAGRWAEVAPPLRQLLDKYPDTPLRLPAEYWIAEACYRSQRFDDAAQRFARLQQNLSGRREAWLGMVPLRRAQLLAREEKWDEAFQAATGIAAAFPGFRRQYEADFVLGSCLAGQSKWAEAREMLERVVRSPDGGGSETVAMAQCLIADTHYQQQQYDHALQACQGVATLSGGYPQWQAAALLLASRCHEKRGRTDDAVESLRQVLQDHPQLACADEATQRLRALGK